MIPSRIERLLVGIYAAGIFVLVGAWAVLLPYGHQYDEPSHYEVSVFIAEHGSLPLMSQMAPTYCGSPHGPCEASYASLPPASPLLQAVFLKVAQVATGRPYADLYLAARLVGVLSIAGFAIALYFVLREVLGSGAAVATGVLAGTLIPQLAYVGGYVNDDALALFAGTLLLQRSLAMLRSAPTWRGTIAIGLIAGVVLLTRLGYAVELGALAVCIGARIAGHREDAVDLLRKTGAIVLLTVAVAGWFYVRNQIVYGDATGVSPIYNDFYRLAPDFKAATIAGQGHGFDYLIVQSSFLLLLFISFWGRFNWADAAYRVLPPAAYAVILVVSLFAIGSTILAAFHGLRNRQGLWWRGVGWGVLAIPMVGSLALAAWNSVYIDFQPQGRYLYPGLPLVAAIFGLGLAGRATGRWAIAIPAVTGLAMLALNLDALVLLA